MHPLGLARFELPTRAKGEKREGFFYSLPGCEVEGKEGEVMLESCQQTSEIQSLLQSTFCMKSPGRTEMLCV